MATRETFSGLIAERTGPDRQGLNAQDFVEPAIRIYERYRPREVVVAVTGNGTESYANSAVSSLWVPGHTRVLGIEYPVGEVPPIWYEDPGNDWAVTAGANTGDNLETRVEYLILRRFAPSASETFRVKFTARHQATGGTGGYSTIPVEDEHAVADFGASQLLQILAVRFGGLATQEGLGADLVIAYDEKARVARDGARDAKRRARMALGLSADERDDEALSGNALAIRNFEMARHLHGGRGGLTHGVGGRS